MPPTGSRLHDPHDTGTGPSRRAFLGTAAAAAALAAVPGGLRAPASAATRTTRTALPGVTLDTLLIGHGVSMLAGLHDWQAGTGCQPMSTKVYLPRRQFPTDVRSTGDGKVAACAALGMTSVLCYAPMWTPPFSKSDAAALERSLAALKAGGLRDAIVVLWPEPQSGHWSPRFTAETFIAGSRFYASAARSAGWPVWWNSMGEQQTWAAWAPGDAVDGYAVDDYASRMNWRDIWAPGGFTDLADRDGKPFGWFEFGIAGGTTARPSTPDLVSFMTESRDYLASRPAGTTGPIIWWAGNDRNALVPASKYPQNAFLIPLWRDLQRALLT